jgi:hypothetical protein
MKQNPYIAVSLHPTDHVSAWDFESAFLDYLEAKGFPMQMLGHREQPDTDKYEQEFLDEMAQEWEDARAEDRYEDLVEERRTNDERYWRSL